jgi:hypothetical protein
MIDKGFCDFVKQLIGDKAWSALRNESEVINKRFIAEKVRFENNPNEEYFNVFLGDIPCPGKKGQHLPISR